MNIILLGATGAGKGTIALQMKDRYKLPHISTGDIFRENIKNNTELGKLAKSYIDKGALVPDDVTTNLIVDRLTHDDCKKGFILDGFPRNNAQAKSLDEAFEKSGNKIDLVILVDATDEQIADRLSGRRVCENCGHIYHIVNIPPKVEGVCDKCGGKLIQRKDDSKEVIQDRLKTYHEITKPLIDYYSKENILKSVPGFVGSQEERLKMIDAMVNA
ncbi:MAG: adenylate kinase [Lachnospiraceae bacterium]|nr:adenylate kinase [Lachnospiraceae bacterium]